VAGLGLVAAAHLAAAEFPNGVLGRPVEVLSADHQNKADIASTIARMWFDNDEVAAVVEPGHSGSALALQKLTQEKSRILLMTGASARRPAARRSGVVHHRCPGTGA
jgi:branched-chain amino acid transport system substrate-binding protein